MSGQGTAAITPPCVLPGYELLASHLTLLLKTHPPAFIYVRDPENPRLTSQAITSAIRNLCLGTDQLSAPQITAVCVDAVACFTPRIFYDTVLNALADWHPQWDDGCEVWSGPPGSDGQRWNDSLDGFIHGLQSIYRANTESSPETSRSAKGKAKEDNRAKRIVVAVERAERLRDNAPDLLVPLTRLAELTQCDIVTIFISNVSWEDIRPSLGASPEPYYIDVPTLSKQAILQILASSYSSSSSMISPATSTSGIVDPYTYHPSLRPLYSHFLETLYSICAPFTHDPHELAYIAAARWPGFVKPVLDEYRNAMEEFNITQSSEINGDIPNDGEDMDLNRYDNPPELLPPTEEVRIRLTRLFTPSFTAALESLYPRRANSTEWAQSHIPPDHLLFMHPAQVPAAMLADGSADAYSSNEFVDVIVEGLPRMAKFILVAAFLASTNPPKSDMRMFGRGPDERAKRRRRKVGTPRKPRPGTTGGSVKLPQRLLGPTSFPLDRLLAIIGVLLEENDADTRPSAPQYSVPGEYTDMEILRVALHAQIMELAGMRLLLPTALTEKMDMAPTFKCGISYDMALRLAREVGIILNDLMWDPA